MIMHGECKDCIYNAICLFSHKNYCSEADRAHKCTKKRTEATEEESLITVSDFKNPENDRFYIMREDALFYIEHLLEEYEGIREIPEEELGVLVSEIREVMERVIQHTKKVN